MEIIFEKKLIVKKLRKSLRELVQVNPQAGHLRLFFFIILIFILWSLLAILSAVYNPLGNLDLTNISKINSYNLAFSLFRDILKAYFSTFTISTLFLILFIFYMSFEILANFYFRLNSFSSIRSSKAYLANCAFSIPQINEFQFPDDFNNSLVENAPSYPEGPLKAMIKPGYALFVNNRGFYKTLINSSEYDDLEVLLGHQEKIIDCFHTRPANVSINLENCMTDIFQSQFINIELSYTFDLPAEQESTNQLSKLFDFCTSQNLRSIIEKVLVSEVKTTINQYSRNSIRLLPCSNGQSQEDKTNIKNKLDISNLVHKTNAFPFNFITKSEKQVIKRNRKRPIYLSPGLGCRAESSNEEKIYSISLIEIVNELLTTNLKKTFKILFGADIIKTKIMKISEQKTK